MNWRSYTITSRNKSHCAENQVLTVFQILQARIQVLFLPVGLRFSSFCIDSHQTSNQFAKLMREKEERIALLEYELRLSREDVEESRKAIKQLLTRENQEGQNHTGALASKEEGSSLIQILS